MSTYTPSPSRRTHHTRIWHDLNPAANIVRERLEEVRAHQQRSILLGSETVLEELDRLTQECASSGWDGYDAAPLNRQSLALARDFVLNLPLGFPRPSPAVDPDGSVSLEWHSAPRRTLSVSIGADGALYYAALFGNESHGGMLCYDEALPDRIADLVDEVIPA